MPCRGIRFPWRVSRVSIASTTLSFAIDDKVTLPPQKTDRAAPLVSGLTLWSSVKERSSVGFYILSHVSHAASRSQISGIRQTKHVLQSVYTVHRDILLRWFNGPADYLGSLQVLVFLTYLCCQRALGS